MVLLLLAAGGGAVLAGGLLSGGLFPGGPSRRTPPEWPAPSPAAHHAHGRQKRTGMAHGFSSATVDIGVFARGVLDTLADTAHRQGIGLRLAVMPGLSARCDPDALHDALRDMVNAAMDHAGTTAILLTARSHGGRIEITVVDDGTGPDGETQISLLRTAEQALALHGATMEIETLAVGTLVRLRLPEPPANPVAAAQPAADQMAPGDQVASGKAASAAANA